MASDENEAAQANAETALNERSVKSTLPDPTGGTMPPGVGPRSGYGSLPGAEFPTAVYASTIAAFGLILLSSWLAFGGATGADLDLAVATVLGLVFFSLPLIMRRTAHLPKQRVELRNFLSARVEIATGTLKGSEAWMQVLIIPLSLVFAAIAIGAVNVLFS
jgi:hypothetical protein